MSGKSDTRRLTIGDKVRENSSPSGRVWKVTAFADGKAQLETPDFTTRIRINRISCDGKRRRTGWSKMVEATDSEQSRNERR